MSDKFLESMQPLCIEVCSFIQREMLYEPNHPTIWKRAATNVKGFFVQARTLTIIYDWAIYMDQDAYFENNVIKNSMFNTNPTLDRGYFFRLLMQPYFAMDYGILDGSIGMDGYLNFTTRRPSRLETQDYVLEPIKDDGPLRFRGRKLLCR
jgi:hypothetical protein